MLLTVSLLHGSFCGQASWVDTDVEGSFLESLGPSDTQEQGGALWSAA